MLSRIPLLSLAFVFVTILSGAQIKGRVVGIADGDTFTLLTSKKESVRVRLHGVDCPEKSQAYGQRAKQFLSELIFDKQVIVFKKNKDRYGRVIGVVSCNDVNVNEKLLEGGWA